MVDHKKEKALDDIRSIVEAPLPQPSFRFHQEVLQEQTAEGIPLLALEYRVEFDGMDLQHKFLTILTPAIGFGLEGGEGTYTLSSTARALIQEGVSSIEGHLKGHRFFWQGGFPEHQTHQDFDAEDLQQLWINFCVRKGLEEKMAKEASYLERRHELHLPNLQSWMDLQWELHERGHDFMLFSDVIFPYVELVEATGEARHQNQLLTFLQQLPDSLAQLSREGTSRCLDLIHLAINYVETCLKSDALEEAQNPLDDLFELIHEEHALSAALFQELAFPISPDITCPPCPENLSFVLSLRRGHPKANPQEA